MNVRSANRNKTNSDKYVVCQDKITPDEPTTNEWLTITGLLTKTNNRDLNRILKGILDKRKTVVIKIGESPTLHKEYTIATILKNAPGFIRPYCFFQCEDNYKEHPSSRTSLCKGPGTSMSVLVLPYLEEGSMREFDWDSKQPQLLNSCLLQLLCSLLQAYETAGILHNDMHLDNVLLKKTIKREIVYIIGNKQVVVPTNGYIVNIMDFELSFNEVASNRGRSLGFVFADMHRAISDLSYDSKVTIHNESELATNLMKMKNSPIEPFNAYTHLKPLIEKITFSSKIQRSFVYDPFVFG